MNILLATEVIHPGGAETFVLRLASALQQSGHNVTLFCFYKSMYNADLHKAIAPEVSVVCADMPLSYIKRKADSLFFKSKIDYSFQNKDIKRSLREILQARKIDIIHSNLLKVDSICTAAGKEMNIPVVTTIHGDYLQFYDKNKKGVEIPILNYSKKAKRNLSELKRIVCISDKQVDFFNDIFQEQTKGKVTKIYNGYNASIPANSTLRKKLGIEDSDFVFGMASRGIKEKGWAVAVEAFLQLNARNTHLILVGGGTYMNNLKKKYELYTNVHFVGHSNEPLEWLNICNIGLLPSTYASESLPTAVIEYLFCGKPVIASDAGEIKNMLQREGKVAGIVIPIREQTVPIAGVATAMKNYITNTSLYEEHKANTAFCFDQFDMDKCVHNYMQVYEYAIADNKKNVQA